MAARSQAGLCVCAWAPGCTRRLTDELAYTQQLLVEQLDELDGLDELASLS